MKNMFIFWLISLILPQLSSAQVMNWSQQYSGLTNQLNSVYFSDNFNGCIVGEAGKILYTANGGVAWNQGISGVTTSLNAVYFTNNLEGWAVGNSGKIIHSLDGGATWAAQTSGTTQQLNSVTFVNDSTGWVVGLTGTVLYTTDYGTTWSSQTINTIPSSNSVSFVNDSTGWIAANGGKVFYTNNKGTNWTLQNTASLNGQNLLSVCFTNANKGWAVGLAGTIIYTENGGASWSIQSSGLPSTVQLLSVCFTDTLNGWIVGTTLSTNGQGAIMHTTNGGANWTTVASGVTSTLKNISSYSSNNAWIAGYNGTILNMKAHEEICLVTVDSIEQKNLIMWERILDQGTDYYKIYKLIGSSYDSIGFVSFGSKSMFIDYGSEPQVHADKYKISAVDINGNESALSPYHQTINLLVGAGVPSSTIILSWNPYVDESMNFIPEKYLIYRSSDGINFEYLDFISGTGVPSYNDINTFSAYYYKIAIVNPEACFPSSDSKQTSGPFSQSISNVDENAMAQGIVDFSDNQKLTVYPNPFSITATIVIPKEIGSNSELKIIDLTGKTVSSIKNISGNKIELNRGNLKSGVYFIELLGEKTYRGKLIID